MRLGQQQIRRRPEKVRDWNQIPVLAVKAIHDCCDGKAPWPLVFIGPPGSGKTCAALCLMDLAGGEYFEAAELSEMHNKAKFGRHEERLPSGGIWRPDGIHLRMAKITKPPLVVLDELGAKKVSDAQYEIVKYVLDLREGRPLVCCSNLDQATLEGVYDGRIVSRLGAGTIVIFEGDRRAS